MTFPFKPNIDKPIEGLPVTRFRGRLKEYTLEEREFDGKKGTPRIKFDFVEDFQVLETRETWAFPFISISIAYQTNDSGKPKANSRWAAFAESCGSALPERDIDLLVGRLQEWAVMPAKLTAPPRDEDGKEIEGGRWTVQDLECWQVVWVEGYGDQEGPGLMDYLTELAVGKSDESFMQAMLTDSKARSMPGFQEAVTMVTDRTLLKTFEGQGKLKKTPEGVWEKV